MIDKKLNPPNPTGKGGFGDNPQNRSSGTWDKNNSFGYWYGFFKHLTVAELKDWVNNNPEEVRTVASDLALRRIQNSQKDLKEFQEVADRSEGKPKQTTDLNVTGDLNVALVEFVDEPDQDTDTTSV